MHRRGCLQHVHRTFQHLTSYLYFIPYVTFLHGFLFLWGLFYSFCTNMNDSHLLQYLIYSLMSSAKGCSAHVILVSGKIRRAASSR